jgi:hypothetical protein
VLIRLRPFAGVDCSVMSSQKLGIVEAFKHYKAKLNNSRWAVSAIAEDGALVVSCWETYFRASNKVLVYEDTLSRWGDANVAGRELLRNHLEKAQQQTLPVCLVIAHWSRGDHRTAEYLHIRPDLRGRVREFDGDRFVIAFAKADGELKGSIEVRQPTL